MFYIDQDRRWHRPCAVGAGDVFVGPNGDSFAASRGGSGLAYVLCFWHAQQIAIMGRWPLSLFYLLLPLPFYTFELGRLGRYRISAVIVGG